MQKRQIILVTSLLFVWTNCSNNQLEEKGFRVNNSTKIENSETEKVEGISKDSVKLKTQPSNVLLTGISNVRLTTLYKVNVNKRDATTFIGSNAFLYNNAELEQGNDWNGHLVPGLEGVYGYNLVNVSHYDMLTTKKKDLFEKAVLIKTLYYPSSSKDTLNKKVVKRNYILVSVYDDDTNKDSFINQKDLRRFYLFDSSGNKQKQIIPENYSVFKSEYDSENDVMFVFARADTNSNGQAESSEPVSIFWVDLKDPMRTGQQY